MYLLKSFAKMHRPYLTLKRKAGVHPAIKFHLVRHARRCPWRIPEITRRWATGRGRDSAAATGTKKSLMASAISIIASSRLPDSDHEGEPHRLVIGIAQADRKAHIAVLVIEVQRAEHLHAVRRNVVFVADYL